MINLTLFPIEYFPFIISQIFSLLGLLLVIIYGFYYILGIREKNRVIKILKNYYNKKQILYYTLDEGVNVNLMQDILKNKYTSLSLNGILQMNNKIIRHWDKKSKIKIEYTLFENKQAETKIFYENGKDWQYIENPNYLLDEYVESPFKRWKITIKDIWDLKTKIKSAFLTSFISLIPLALYIIVNSFLNLDYNLFAFVESNSINIIVFELILVCILLFKIYIGILQKKY